jgi:hypothetical protein
MLENSVAEPVEPVSEESQASSRHRSCAISCAERGTAGEGEVQSGADEELSPTHTEAAKGGDGEQHADEDEVDERRSQPPEEAARVDVKRRADVDEVGEAWP